MEKNFEKVNIVVLTAGKGSRMNSELPKIFHKVAGRSLFEHVLSSVEKIKADKNIIAITSNDILKDYKDLLPKQENINYVIQETRDGTGDAVKYALKSKYWENTKYTGVFYGDVPFVSNETINKLFSLQKRYDLVVLGFEPQDQTRAYGRLFTERDLLKGQHCPLYQIKEFKELMREKPRLCNSGIIVGKTEIFEKLLPLIDNKNKAKEYYLTDIVELANSNNYNVGTYICDEYEVIGINSRIELAHAEKAFQEKLSEKHLLNGVTMLHRDSVHFSYDTKIGKDVIMESNVFFGVGVKIGDNCLIRSGSYLENLEMKNNSDIGPYARVRGNKTIIGEKVHIGNFAEIKNSLIGDGTKIGHFSYTGDAVVGKNVNYGAGCVICNYDGKEKHKTIIGDNCFIGSNSTIIAPCEIEDNSYIAGGSVITKKVESGSLAIARERQTNIQGWVSKRGLNTNDDKKVKNKSTKIIIDKKYSK